MARPTKEQHPNASVRGAAQLDEVVRVVVWVDTVRVPPIAPGGLYRNKPEWTEVLKLHRLVEQDGNKLVFETYNHAGPLPKEGDRYILQSWWTPSQLGVAQSDVIRWSKQHFQAENAAVSESQGATIVRRLKGDEPVASNERLVRGRWDHAHCALCWKSIEVEPGCQRGMEAYTDGDEWLCVRCYSEYISSGFGRRLG